MRRRGEDINPPHSCSHFFYQRSDPSLIHCCPSSSLMEKRSITLSRCTVRAKSRERENGCDSIQDSSLNFGRFDAVSREEIIRRKGINMVPVLQQNLGCLKIRQNLNVYAELLDGCLSATPDNSCNCNSFTQAV